MCPAPPTMNVTGVTNGASFVLGSVPAAGCAATDALSGLAVAESTHSAGAAPEPRSAQEVWTTPPLASLRAQPVIRPAARDRVRRRERVAARSHGVGSSATRAQDH
jgi:hypothetical protein